MKVVPDGVAGEAMVEELSKGTILSVDATQLVYLVITPDKLAEP